MQTMKQQAMNYEPKTTRNIAELDSVSVDIQLLDGTGKDKEGVEFSYKYTVINQEEYRVPGVVLGELKKILKLRPDTKKVKVNKKGSGLSTKYEVEFVE